MKKAVICLVIILMLAISGCMTGNAIVAKKVNAPTATPVEAKAIVESAQQVQKQTTAPAIEKPIATTKTNSCGDGKCVAPETCDSCFQDCACKSPAECYNDACKVPECGGNGDCKDDNACTKDVCEYAQHPNAFCTNNKITICDSNDGCCPEDCMSDNDNDCTVCGDDECESSEDSESCPEDCTDCGDDKCTGDEDEDSCPEDCSECGDGTCSDSEDSDDCSEDCCEPDTFFMDDEECECMDDYDKEDDTDGEDSGFKCVEE
jgi:hypothetical protein